MIEAYTFTFHFDEPVRIASKTFTSNNGVLVLIRNGKHVGYGEARPDLGIMGDSSESVIEYIKKNKDLIPVEISLHSIKEFHQKAPSGCPSALAAVDIALHDLWGKINNAAVCDLYLDEGMDRNIPPNCITVFGKPVEGVYKDVKSTLEKYPKLKILKIKLMGEDDIQRCVAAKDVVEKTGREMSYVLDCNEVFTSCEEATSCLLKLKEILGEIVAVEEPVSAKDWDLMSQVKSMVDIPLYADESVVNMQDLQVALKKKCVDGVNIKIQKVGGIWPAKCMADICEKNGVGVMVGCMLESGVGISAGIHFAQSTQNVLLTDLDYDLSLPDVYCTRNEFKGDAREVLDCCGLGVELDFDKIGRLKEKRTLLFDRVI